jgi:hypothetical protein
MINRKLSLPLLILVTLVTLLFGLWPLDFFPDNQVRWLTAEDGVQFHKEGISSRGATGGVIYSDAPLDVRTGSHRFGPTTIEIYVESHAEADRGLAHIVSFHDGYPCSPLVIGQWKSYLIIRSRHNDNETRDSYREIDLKDGLGTNQKKLITIASGPERAEIYVNGELARSYNVRSLIGAGQFRGYLCLGNSSIGQNAWVGNLYGLALYDKLLTSGQIRQHSTLWANKPVEMPAVIEPKPMILYTFAERTGSLVRNQAGSTNHLTIRPTFKALKGKIVVQFWREMVWEEWFIADVIVNILGFVPFACCLFMFLAGNRHASIRQVAFLTVLAGAILSLIIEISQMGLPTRSPSSLDFLCNTAGAALGVLLVRIVAHVRARG